MLVFQRPQCLWPPTQSQRSSMPTIEADIKLAMVPGNHGAEAELGQSPRLLGARALMPPI